VARIPGGGSSPTRLQRVALEQVGAFVFVNLAEHPLAIREQFDQSLLASLEQVSASFDHEVASTLAPARHNWKLGFENVLDPGHVHYLHAKTFGRDVPRPGAELRPTVRGLRGLSFHQAAPFSLKTADWHGYVTPFGAPPSYHNWFLYPNVNFVSIGGYSFSLHQFNPVSAGDTEILMVQFLARRKREMFFSPAVLWHNMQAEKRILDEDIVALDRLQAGLGDSAQRAVLGPLDARVADFLDWQAGLLRESS
jgi:phenylpropionate dioxygenase-like ring-hydroxylating dioxygenase large terminal subunit